VWLRSAGYRTAFLGKHVNNYGKRTPRYVPPGWDRWFAFVPPNGANYYEYTMNVDGRLVRRGSAPADYSTDVLASEADRFIRVAKEPFLLLVAPHAPHTPFTPAPRHADVPVSWRPGPAYNVVDKRQPEWMQRLPPVEAGAVATGQIRSLMAVDELVGRLVTALEETGRLSNTAIIYTSDNGHSWGEHRWLSKLAPHEESIRVPLVVRADGLAVPGDRSELVANIDLAPTVAELAGRLPPLSVDGRSLLPLLTDSAASWRRFVVLESVRYPIPSSPLARVPSYCGIRMPATTYVQYSTGEEEVYDLTTDPFQLMNLRHVHAWQRRLAELRGLARRHCYPLPPVPANWVLR
jgi:arylsulfatase A-like enzyme